MSPEQPQDTEAEPQSSPEPPEPEISEHNGSFLPGQLASSSISLESVDAILRDGSNRGRSILHIAAYFSKGKTTEDNADFLCREYKNGGKGFTFGEQKVSAWFDESGIRLGVGKSALQARDAVHITWEQAAARIKELFDAGLYIRVVYFPRYLDPGH